MGKSKSFLGMVLGILLASACVSAQESVKPDAEKKPDIRKPAETVELKTIKPFFYCAVEMTGHYDQHGTAFENLYSSASAQNVNSGDVPFGIYWNGPDNTPVEKLKWEIGFSVPDSTAVKEPLKLKKWGFTTLARTEFNGPFQSPEMNKVYEAIFQWIGQNQYQLCGPVLEKFLDTPEQNAQGGWSGHVEIWLPVQKQ